MSDTARQLQAESGVHPRFMPFVVDAFTATSFVGHNTKLDTKLPHELCGILSPLAAVYALPTGPDRSV